MKKQTIIRIVSVVLLLIMMTVLLTGCIPNRGIPSRQAGFFSGIWHGWIAPISLIFSLFGRGSIYESYNTGFTYDLGFYMAIISGFGTLALSRKKKNKDD